MGKKCLTVLQKTVVYSRLEVHCETLLYGWKKTHLGI